MILSPWNSPGKNTGVGSHSLPQGIFLSQRIKSRSAALQEHSLPQEPEWGDLYTACLELVHGDDPERGYGEGGGREVHVWERMYTRGGFMSMYGKTSTVL